LIDEPVESNRINHAHILAPSQAVDRRDIEQNGEAHQSPPRDNHLKGEKQMRTFIKWNNVYDFCVYLSDYIDRHKGNYARWNAISKERQVAYQIKVDKIKNRFI